MSRGDGLDQCTTGIRVDMAGGGGGWWVVVAHLVDLVIISAAQYLGGSPVCDTSGHRSPRMIK